MTARSARRRRTRSEEAIRRGLTGLRAPDEAGAEERAWSTVAAAYRDRPAPVTRRRSRVRILAVPVLAVVVGAVAFSPAGATVKRIINRALSVPHIARTAGLSLPAPGRLLVSGSAGTWVVSTRGSVRRLGLWTDATWSPRGRYVAVAGTDSLAAVTPGGAVAWRLPESGVSDPRWYPPSGYRVAYRVGGDLREVAGDGRADHLLATRVAPLAPAWRPGHPFQLAYVTHEGAVVVRGGDTGAITWHSGPHPGRPLELSWTPSGTRLELVTSAGAWLYLPGQSPPFSLRLPVRGPLRAAVASPDGRRLALVGGGGTQGLQIADLTEPTRPPRTVLSGIPIGRPTWSPDGGWLVASWSAQDEWLFVDVVGRPRILAESRVSERLRSRAAGSGPLRIDGWCCAQ